MKKKLLLLIPIIVVMLLGINVNAKIYKSDRVKNSTYIIGRHMFDRNKNDKYNGVLTMGWIMSASRSIGEDVEADDMIIYYKNAKGKWINAINNQEVEFPEEGVEIFFVDGVYSVVPAPDLMMENSNPLDARFSINNLVDYCYDDCESSPDAIRVDGYVLYKLNDETGEFVNIGESQQGVNPLTQEFHVSVEPNESSTFAVRLYTNAEDGETDYTEYGTIEVNGYIPRPTLELTWKREDDPNAYDKILYDANNNGWYTNVHLNTHGYRYDYYGNSVELDNIYDEYNTQNPNDFSADGYDVFEGGTDRLVASTARVSDTAKIFEDLGAEKNYYARAYKYNSSGEKVYSSNSDEIQIRFVNSLRAPEFEVDREFVGSYFKYDVSINKMDYCIANCTDDDATNNIYSIDGFDVYLQHSDDSYTSLNTEIPTVNGNPDYLAPRTYVIEPNTTDKLRVEVYKTLSDGYKSTSMSPTSYDVDTTLPSPKVALDGNITCNGTDENATCSFNLIVPITDDLIFRRDFWGNGTHLLKVDNVIVYDRNNNPVLFNKVDPNTGEQLYDEETGIPLTESVIKIGESRKVTGVERGIEAYYYAKAYYVIVDGDYQREYYSRNITEEDVDYIERFTVIES